MFYWVSSRRFLLRRVWHLAIPTPPAIGYSPTEYAEFTEPPIEMSSHGFHRFTQILMVRCSPTEFTEFTEFGSVGMAGMPYPPTSVLICAICGRLFSVRSFRAFRAFSGNICPPTDFTDLHRSYGAPSRGCTCLKCTNRAIGAFCFVGAVLALASGKAERRQLHPLGWQRGGCVKTQLMRAESPIIT